MDKFLDKGDPGKMKFNLKNHPKRKTPIVWPDPYFCDFYYEILEWLEDFEKELWKELDKCEIGLPYCEKCQKIKEILGE